MTLSGYYSDTWGNPLAGRPLLLTISNKGFERAFDVTASSDGLFAAQFVPVPGEAGIFEVSARHPDYIGEAAHSSFSVAGMEFGWADYTLTMARNSSYTFEAEFTNTGETPLQGLSAAIQNISGFGITASPAPFPAFIAAGTRQKLAVSFTAETSASDTAEFILKVTDANGFERTLPIHLKTLPAQVISRITPHMLELGMFAGEIRTQLVTVENIGFSAWTDVRVSTPLLSWARIDGLQNTLGDIGPGKNASFTILFEPPAGMANGSYAEDPLVTITGGGAGAAPVTAVIVITSSRKGDIFFNVASADIPKEELTGRLGGVDMRLISLDIAGMAFTAKTDSNGLARFEGVPSGKYMYKAETGGYNPVTGTVAVEPGLDKTVDVFMPTTMVTYKWSVTPTTIQDKYDITLEMTFRTDVPAPALIMDPPTLTLNMKGGETIYTQLTLKNKGLVSVFDLKADISGDGVLHLETPVQNIAELKAMQSMVIPLKITLDHASGHSGSYCLNGHYQSACGPVPASVCFSMSGGNIVTSGWGGIGGGGGA